MVSLGTINRPNQPVNTVTRRPVRNTSERPDSGAVKEDRTPRRASVTNTASRPRQTINPQRYPTRKKRRRKTGRILLGIVVSIILIAVAVGTLCVLDHNGVIDLSGTISSISAFVRFEFPQKGLDISIAKKPLFELFDFSRLA